MIRRPPRSTLSSSSAASDVYKRQVSTQSTGGSSMVVMRLLCMGSLLLLCSAAPPIDHVVLLMMENRPYDFFFGWAGLPGANGLTGRECNLFNTSDPSKGKACVAKSAPYICKHPPGGDFSTWTSDIFGPGVWNGSGPPYPRVAENATGYLQTNSGNQEVMWQLDPAKIPVKMAVAQDFAVFDTWYTSFPGPSTPNHLFAQTATSRGCTTTGATYQCKPGQLFSQKTIYESLMESNKSWAYFYNDSAWNSFIQFFHTPGSMLIWFLMLALTKGWLLICSGIILS
eukprot:TRINITY_DN11053_c0_g1_i8.p2 TRINITY_DN11053_c0_g1~~TRINITY_DN11053_c0_g1_i8.p2  ORF type:complete len:284 (+),score=51.94 TRINITY_DN11053_c0_g1_i8:123-974(+)